MMNKKTYSEKLQDPRWQKVRMRILSRDEWKCRLCGASEITLHIHHEKYNNEPWDANEKDLKTVCKNCHAIIHDVKKIENGTVVHIEKNLNSENEYEVYMRNKKTTGIAFYKINKTGKAIFSCGFYKSAIDRFSTILNSL